MDDLHAARLARRLRELRLALKQREPALGSQAAVARAVGVGAQTVSRWECGVQPPDGRHLRALARVYRVPVEELDGES